MVSDADLIAKATELIGSVIPGEASARHSCVEGGCEKTTQGESTMFTLVAKDNKANPMTGGGDLVQATMLSKLCIAMAGEAATSGGQDNGCFEWLLLRMSNNRNNALLILQTIR